MIAILAAFAPTVLAVVAFIAWRRGRRELAATATYRITAADVGVPELLLLQADAVRVRIGAKWLYVQCLRLPQAEVYYAELKLFIDSHRKILDVFKIFDLADSADIASRQRLRDIAASFFGARPAWRSALRLIKRTALADKACNPHKVSARYFASRISPDELMQIFCALYWYNVGAGIKKKYTQLARALDSWEARGLASCTPWKLPDWTQPESSQNLCHACGQSLPDTRSGNPGVDTNTKSDSGKNNRVIAQE